MMLSARLVACCLAEQRRCSSEPSTCIDLVLSCWRVCACTALQLQLSLSSDPGRCCAELSPLTVKVEKGSISRLFVRPIRSAFLNVSSTVPPKANPDEFQSLATNEGLVYVQYSASGTTNTKFTASMGTYIAPHPIAW